MAYSSRFAQRTPNKRVLFRMWKKDENNTNMPFTEDDLENQLIVNIVDDIAEIPVYISKGYID